MKLNIHYFQTIVTLNFFSKEPSPIYSFISELFILNAFSFYFFYLFLFIIFIIIIILFSLVEFSAFEVECLF